MIKSALIVCLFLLPGLANAVICKTVNAEGVVAYAEVPAHECRTPLTLPDYSRYSPRPIEQRSTTEEVAATDREVVFEGYESMQIVKPEANGKVFSNEGKVPLAIVLEPALQPGHRINVFLDDTLIPVSFDGLVIELTGVNSGLHNVRAAVFDADGERVFDSTAVNFILREANQINRPPNPTPPPTPE